MQYDGEDYRNWRLAIQQFNLFIMIAIGPTANMMLETVKALDLDGNIFLLFEFNDH